MDSSSFAGSKDPFGGGALDPSRDFFQPLGVQNPTTSFSAPPQLKPPSPQRRRPPAGWRRFAGATWA